jgi:hypothetical protein
MLLRSSSPIELWNITQIHQLILGGNGRMKDILAHLSANSAQTESNEGASAMEWNDTMKQQKYAGVGGLVQEYVKWVDSVRVKYANDIESILHQPVLLQRSEYSLPWKDQEFNSKSIQKRAAESKIE